MFFSDVVVMSISACFHVDYDNIIVELIHVVIWNLVIANYRHRKEIKIEC